MLLLVLTACSTIKGPQIPEARVDADNNLNFALRLESQDQLAPARESYQYAYGIYQSFAGISGQLACLSGLARLDLAEGDSAGYAIHYGEIENFIAETAPALDYYLLLLKVYEKQQVNDFAGVSAISLAKAEYPLADKLKLATAKLQADSYLKQVSPTNVAMLKNLADTFHKQVKKGISTNPELLSTAWYALAYHYFIQGDLAMANRYADSTRDWDYRYGNFSGLGHALWLKGQIAMAEGQTGEALSWFRRAAGIFQALADSKAEAAVQAAIFKLKGVMP